MGGSQKSQYFLCANMGRIIPRFLCSPEWQSPPLISTCPQSCRSPAVLVTSGAWVPPPIYYSSLVQQLLCKLQMGKGDICTLHNIYCGTCPQSLLLLFPRGSQWFHKATLLSCHSNDGKVTAPAVLEIPLSCWRFHCASSSEVSKCALATSVWLMSRSLHMVWQKWLLRGGRLVPGWHQGRV